MIYGVSVLPRMSFLPKRWHRKDTHRGRLPEVLSVVLHPTQQRPTLYVSKGGRILGRPLSPESRMLPLRVLSASLPALSGCVGTLSGKHPNARWRWLTSIACQRNNKFDQQSRLRIAGLLQP